MSILEILEAHYVSTTREYRVVCKTCGILTEEFLLGGEQSYRLGITHQAEVLEQHEREAKAGAWDQGATTAWERSTPEVNGSNYHWRSSGEPRNPYRKENETE